MNKAPACGGYLRTEERSSTIQSASPAGGSFLLLLLIVIGFISAGLVLILHAFFRSSIFATQWQFGTCLRGLLGTLIFSIPVIGVAALIAIVSCKLRYWQIGRLRDARVAEGACLTCGYHRQGLCGPCPECGSEPLSTDEACRPAKRLFSRSMKRALVLGWIVIVLLGIATNEWMSLQRDREILQQSPRFFAASPGATVRFVPRPWPATNFSVVVSREGKVWVND